MKNIRELLREADPLRNEPMWPSGRRDLCRQTVLAAASGARSHSGAGSRSWIVVFAAVALMVIAASFLGVRVWSPFVVQAAVRFEVRLAEDRPALGLHEAKVSGSDRSVYLHDEVIVTNSDISVARVVQGGGPLRYSVSVEFNATGAEKMRAATSNHMGKPMAVLLDGHVVIAPTVRSIIGESALITGNYTRSQAGEIVSGITIR